MINRQALVNSKEYWLVQMQAALYEQVAMYMQKHQLSQTDFAKQLGVSKGYISQLLNGDFDHKLSKLVTLSLAIGKAPMLQWHDLEPQEEATQAPPAHTYPIAEQPPVDYLRVAEGD